MGQGNTDKQIIIDSNNLSLLEKTIVEITSYIISKQMLERIPLQDFPDDIKAHIQEQIKSHDNTLEFLWNQYHGLKLVRSEE